MTEPKRTYGLWIERLERQGTQYVICRVMSREDESDHPLNAMDRYDEPYLEGLVLEGFVTDYPPAGGR